jgi:hypothetical protein
MVIRAVFAAWSPIDSLLGLSPTVALHHLMECG